MAVRHIIGAVLAIALAASPMTLAAQEGGSGEGRVVARVNGEEIHWSDVLALVRTLPQQYQTRLMEIYPMQIT